MADNAQIARDVLAAVGGKENVRSVQHCMTRLRFNLVDEASVNDDEVKAVKGAMGVAKQGGQYQVIIGTNFPRSTLSSPRSQGSRQRLPSRRTSTPQARSPRSRPRPSSTLSSTTFPARSFP